MNKAKIISVSTQIALTSIGVILGLAVYDGAKKMLLKNTFAKPMNVTIEEE